VTDRDKKYLTTREELEALREECSRLRDILEDAPLYLAALAGFVRGQTHEGADADERARVAREIADNLKTIGKGVSVWTSGPSRSDVVPVGEDQIVGEEPSGSQ
jgi:hypothetical protein